LASFRKEESVEKHVCATRRLSNFSITRMSVTSHDPCPSVASADESEATVIDLSTLQDAVTACPAFADTSCPFSDATTPQEIRAKLAQMPASHAQHADKYVQAVSLIHQNNQRVATLTADAMEGLSLSAIMVLQVTRAESSEHLEETVLRPSLSQSLKTGTAVSHQAAEDVHFVKNFIKGIIDRDLYADLVLQLYKVYDVLEELLDRYADRHFASCHFPKELARRSALELDVDFWHSKSPERLPLSPATQDYVDRLRDVAERNPLLLLAHSYTRYLGDLSGGKILARVAKRAMHLDGDGLDFYKFEHIESTTLFKNKYRQALDDLPLSDSQVKALVAEANVAFALNMRMFEDLDVKANVPGACVRPVAEALKYASPDYQAPDVDASDECPFLQQKKQSADTHASEGRCPWPFIFAHDPAQGMRDWQTWLVLGLVLSWIWSKMQG